MEETFFSTFDGAANYPANRHRNTSMLQSYVIKRLFDVIAAMVVFVGALPIMVFIGVLIRCNDNGPIFFKQVRIGLNLKPFLIYKFRTMSVKNDTMQALQWSADEEARITKIGQFLRDYGLDELPQIINILKGDMSIIGPRPPLPGQAALFSERQKKMFLMKPGVFSLAATKGRRSISLEERYEMHVQYVEDWRLALDWKIFFKTTLVVITGQDARERLKG